MRSLYYIMEDVMLPTPAAVMFGSALEPALPPPPARDASQMQVGQFGVAEAKFDAFSDEDSDDDADDALLPPGPVDPERCTVRS